MVPLMCLLALVPLVACGGMDYNQQQMMMQQQQMMMQQGWGGQQQGWGGQQQGWGGQQQGWGGQQQGWGGQQQGGQQQGGQQQGGQQSQQWWGMQTQEDHEAYLKWCEERKMAMQEQQQQQELLQMWEQQEEQRKMEVERKRVERESNERHESMMAQWKMWQMQIANQHQFDDLMYKFAEMKHSYMFLVTMEMLKFCKCSDFTADVERYFVHEGVDFHTTDEFDLDDLEGFDSTNPTEVAQAFANRPVAEQIKAFFGGLAMSLCEAGRAYVDQVHVWDKQYNFIDRHL